MSSKQKRTLTSGRRCKLCEEQGWPDNFGSEPKCAFSSGVFSPENWACGTALALRDKTPWDKAKWCDDQYASLLPIGYACFLVAGWYKSRGQQEFLGILDGTEMKPVTLECAEAILDGKFEQWADQQVEEQPR